MNTLFENPKYRAFIDERNKALEQINLNAQTDISRILHEALESISGFVSQLILTRRIEPATVKITSSYLQGIVTERFNIIEPKIVERLKRLRRSTFYLTYLGELEGIARATQKTSFADVFEFKRKLQAQEESSGLLGRPLDQAVYPSLLKLQSKIVVAFATAVLRDEGGPSVLEAVMNAYPKTTIYTRPPRTLKPLAAFKESDQDPKDKKEFDFYHDLTNDTDWDDAVQDYTDTQLPPSRFDSAAEYNPETSTMQYSWELEQDITDDFVKQVRDGQVAAATDLGVKDFVWVAVIDKKTCETCCIPRAGKLVSEIEQMLKDGDLDKTECDAVVPPAHPYCRCDIAPVASQDPVEGPDWKSFGEWLES